MKNREAPIIECFRLFGRKGKATVRTEENGYFRMVTLLSESSDRTKTQLLSNGYRVSIPSKQKNTQSEALRLRFVYLFRGV